MTNASPDGPLEQEGTVVDEDDPFLTEALEAIVALQAGAAAVAAQIGGAATTHEARSDDGSVVVLATGGQLTRVDIEAAGFDRGDHDALTATLLATARAALSGATATEPGAGR